MLYEFPDSIQSEKYEGPIQILDGSPYTFIDITGEEQQSLSGSYSNLYEAKVILKLLQSVSNDIVERRDMKKIVRIITFYQGQVSCIQRIIREHYRCKRKNLSFLTATVDSSQG